MNLLARSAVAVVAVAALSLGAVGCKGGGDKCEKAIDNAVSLTMEAASQMGGGDKVDEMKKQIEEQKGQAIEDCRKKLQEEPEKTGEALDCLAGAENLQDLGSCESSFSGVMQ